MSDKKKRVPKYKMIENDIINKIYSGEYSKGSPIPTEQELAEMYGVSRVTVRQATNNLVAKGYLTRTQGSGTYVSNPSIVGRTTQIKSFTEEMEELGKEVTTEVLKFEIIPASNSISKKLNIEPESLVYFIKRLRKADGIPMMLEITYMGVSQFPDLSYEKIMKSKYKYVEESKNALIDYSHQIVIPIMPTEEIVKYFNCSPEMPILKVLNTTFLSTGEILDYTELYLNTDKYQYQSIKYK